MSETATRVASDSLQVGDRFLLGETIVTVKARGGESFWSPELGGSFSYSGLHALFPNGVPLLPPAEPEKPKEWTVKISYGNPSRHCRWWVTGEDTINDFLVTKLDDDKKYEVTIKEVPQ